MPGVFSRSGNTGYRDQLDRVRRLLDRVESAGRDMQDFADFNEYDFQDDVYSFFQACWHVKDWVKHDPQVEQPVKDAIKTEAESNKRLLVCHDICNGTKHLKLTVPRAQGARVEFTHVETRGGMIVAVDFGIADDTEELVGGKLFARQCVEEWERILQSHELATARRS